MSQTKDFDDEQLSVLKKVEKLMRLAGKNPSEAEAASAARKAQELLVAYNLDASAIGEAEDGKRGEEKLRGGFYKYERDLWSSIAELHFCYHWFQTSYVERSEKDAGRAKMERYSDFARRYRKRNEHRLVGRRVNVAATRMMAEYLLSTIERLTREYLGIASAEDGTVVGSGESLRGRRATSFRSGVADRVVGKIWDRRREMMREEAQREREAHEAAVAAGRAGVGSDSTQLTLSTLSKSEREANDDFLYGEGFSARRAADRAARAHAAAEAEAAYSRWAEAHPDEARAEAEAQRKEDEKRERRRARRGGGGWRAPKAPDRDDAAYYAGYDAGANVGLDQQVGESASRSRIGR